MDQTRYAACARRISTAEAAWERVVGGMMRSSARPSDIVVGWRNGECVSGCGQEDFGLIIDVGDGGGHTRWM